VTQLITNAQRNGPYTLQTIHLEDLAGDKISYHRDGTTDSQAAGGQLPNGTHDFDFSTGDFTVSGQGTGCEPALTSFSLHNATLNHGDTVAIDFAATDVGAALYQ